jgi:hypothetical protein
MNAKKLANIPAQPKINSVPLVEKITADSGYVPPEDLHKVLRRASSHIVTFSSEKSLRHYRQKLYSINHDGIRRYRTIRDDYSMFGIIIIRIK